MAGNGRREIRLVKEEGDSWWVATDETLEISCQGPTRREALQNLDGAIALYLSAAEETDGVEMRDLPDIRPDDVSETDETIEE